MDEVIKATEAAQEIDTGTFLDIFIYIGFFLLSLKEAWSFLAKRIKSKENVEIAKIESSGKDYGLLKQSYEFMKKDYNRVLEEIDALRSNNKSMKTGFRILYPLLEELAEHSPAASKALQELHAVMDNAPLGES